MRLVIDLRFSFTAALAVLRAFVRENGEPALAALAALSEFIPYHGETYPEVAGNGSITLLLAHPRVGRFAAQRYNPAIPAWAAVAYAAAGAAANARARAARNDCNGCSRCNGEGGCPVCEDCGDSVSQCACGNYADAQNGNKTCGFCAAYPCNCIPVTCGGCENCDGEDLCVVA